MGKERIGCGGLVQGRVQWQSPLDGVEISDPVSIGCYFVSQKFFQPAVDNIKNNLGASSVSEEHVREVCRQILEDAKQMYCSNSQSRVSSPFNELSDSETGIIWECRFGRPNTQVICCFFVAVY
jgi:hypothetical protein